MIPWISRKCMKDILAAVQANDNLTHIINIVGEGGTGKTVLLRQIGESLGSTTGMESSFPWSGILDLFHSEVNTNSGLETLLSHALDKNGEFQKYLMEREAFKQRRESGEYGPELEQERSNLSNLFAECINLVTSSTRIIIALDTTEKIQYEMDEIQTICQLEGEGSSVKEWLLFQLKLWRNCVVLLAGRPNPEFEDYIENELSGLSSIIYHKIELGGFDEDETLEYFSLQESAHAIVSELDDTLRRIIWRATKGKPIRLDLAIYIAEHELGLENFQRLLEEQAQKELDRTLIEHVMQHDPDTSVLKILRYLAIARKGLDAQLLQYLAGEWTIKECESKLDKISDRSYIKKRPDDGRLFLHDEMYILCDNYMFDTPTTQELSGKLASWYDEKTKTSKDQKVKQYLQVDSLIYRMRAHPGNGYNWYATLLDEAIRYGEVGLDMRLRHELFGFLRSMSPRDQELIRNNPELSKQIMCDAAANWVKRYVSRGSYEKAIKVGKTVIQNPDLFCQPNTPNSQLALAELTVFYAQALIYASQGDDAIILLKKTIAELEQEQKPEDLSRQGDPHAYTAWRRNLVLGRAHNNLGYTYWQGRNQYHLALEELRMANPYFRASDLEEEYANTLDNMGRIYAQLYEKDRAEAMMDDSLALRRKLSRKYRIGLGLNARAIGHLMFGDPYSARRLSEEAFNIFDSLDAQRGIGLSAITLGRALRKLGNISSANQYPLTDCDKYFKDSQIILERSIDIFESRVPETSRLINALNELGCTYRDRSAMFATADEGSDLSTSLAYKAIDRLQESANMAKDKYPTMYVDSCEDIAQTYYQLGNYKYAKLWLERALAVIPREYMFEEGKGVPTIPDENLVEEDFLGLGKIELAYGYISYEVGLKNGNGEVPRKDLAEAMRHFIFSSAYFELFSSRAAGRETAYKQLYERFKKCKYDDLRYLEKELIPKIAHDFGLDPKWVNGFFEDTLGLALQLEQWRQP